MVEVKKPRSKPFKICSKCGYGWPTRASFLHDSKLRMVGYQVDFADLRAGLFLFNHICGTTLAIQAGDFQDLYDGPIFVERMDGSEDCGGFCLHENDLRPCPARCECAYVREIARIILDWPKHDSPGGGRARQIQT